MTATLISALVLCRGRRCIGKTGDLDPDCPRCGGIESEHWGVDPVSLRGCVDERDEPEHDHDED
jgi:hypothetical protein